MGQRPATKVPSGAFVVILVREGWKGFSLAVARSSRTVFSRGAQRPSQGARDGGVEVIVAVDVGGPVTVAVHVHVNDTLIVI